MELDYKKALDYFEKSCDLGVARSCAAIGEIYYFGEGVEKDRNKGLKYFKKACDMGDKEACMVYLQMKNGLF